MQQAQLAAALDYIREGDVLLVTKPDRLACSVTDLLDIAARPEKKGVALRILSMPAAAIPRVPIPRGRPSARPAGGGCGSAPRTA
jgi:hypothetical protein